MSSRYRFRSSLTLAVVAAVSVGAPVATVAAQSITYTFAGTASGTLGGTPFTGQAFTVTILADASTVTTAAPGIRAVQNVAGTLVLPGFAPATLTSLYVFNNQNVQHVGFGGAGTWDIFTVGPDASLASYDLTTTFGPIPDAAPAINTLGDIGTSAGTLRFSSATGVGTFGAATGSFGVTATPEPATWALLSIGLVGIGGVARRRRVASRG